VLDQADAVSYLLDRGLLTRQGVVDGGVVVRDASSRNRNFAVECAHGPSFLLKQGLDPDGVATVQHEARVYEALLAGDRSLRRYLPTYFGYDPNGRILVVELLGRARDLRAYHAGRRRFPVTVAGRIGAALGTLHRVTACAAVHVDPSRAPGPLWLHRPDLGIFRDASAASLELVRTVQHAPGFGERLDEVRAGWRIAALVHHDVKWDNLVACAAGATNRIRGVKLVDWEIATEGDPAWDIGSAFGAYLSAWIFSVPVTGREPPERFAELAQVPLSAVQPPIGRCWEAYLSAARLRRSDRRPLLVRAVEMAAVRLLQTGYESTQVSTRLHSNSLLHLQASLNMLQRPEEAAMHLLGIPLWAQSQ